MEDNKGPQKDRPGMGAGLEALALCGQLGLTLAIPIVLGAVAGHWLDGKLKTGMIFLILLLILGIAAGIIGAYNQVMSVTKKKK